MEQYDSPSSPSAPRRAPLGGNAQPGRGQGHPARQPVRPVYHAVPRWGPLTGLAHWTGAPQQQPAPRWPNSHLSARAPLPPSPPPSRGLSSALAAPTARTPARAAPARAPITFAPSNAPNPFAAMEPWELLGFAPPPSRRPAVALQSSASPSASASAPAAAAGVGVGSGVGGGEGASAFKPYVSSMYVELAEGESIWDERVTPQQRALWLSGFGPRK